VQVKDAISIIKTGVKIEPLQGEKFIRLSDYSIVEITNPTYSVAAMGMSKKQNVSMLFSMVRKRICQQINNKSWEKAKDTLNQAQYAAYINVRGKKCIRKKSLEKIQDSCVMATVRTPLEQSSVNTHCCPTRRMRLRK
jgi:ribosomal protein L22